MKKEYSIKKLTCECEKAEEAAVKEAKANMPDEETIYDLSDFFKIFADSSRLNILFAIDKKPLCTCEIAEALGMQRSTVSHQMKILRQSALVKYRKSGKNVYYSLADDHVKDIIEKALEHIKE